ncbi:uncharacterized protein LOC142790032 [Rhipicephalus microplus]|uniref:uncharacterized protein LOC142790032 n=1 Tax=Rhipicephalus microplus TaxID=6941 RepID=UPI003F6D62BD
MAASGDGTLSASAAAWPSPAQRKPRKRFRIDGDLCLLKEVVCADPFSNPAAWEDVLRNVMRAVNRELTIRDIKERVDHFIGYFRQQDTVNLRKQQQRICCWQSMRMTSESHQIEVTGQQATEPQPAQQERCRLLHQALGCCTRRTSCCTRKVKLDIFVFMGYFRYGINNHQGCLMVPPTFLPSALPGASSTRPYKDNLGSAFTYLSAHSDKWPSNTQRAVGVGLQGSWYTPCAAGSIVNNRPVNYSLGHRCGYSCKKYQIDQQNETTSIVKACMLPTYNSSFYMDTTFEALVAFDVKEEIVFTYDSAKNLRSKVCQAKKLATNVTNMMAAVDIQFEDYNNSCGHGRYPRLYMLRKLSAFLSYRYTSPDKEAECFSTS